MSVAPDHDSSIEELLDQEPIRTASRLAYQLSLFRGEQKLTRVREVTRSAMLWALMVLDEGVEQAFEQAGVGYGAWSKQLGLEGDLDSYRWRLAAATEIAGPPSFNTDLVDAVERYIDRYRTDVDAPPTLAQLALVILDSIDSGRSTVLPRRLDELRFDEHAARDGLRRLLDDTTQSIDLDDFSPSVRHVIDRIGLASSVTPSRLAAELADLHPNYANGLLGKADFSGDTSPPYPLVDLLATVRHQAGDLDPGTRIHTRDVVIHLASFHDPVRDALDEVGAHDVLLTELGHSTTNKTVTTAPPVRPDPDRPELDMLADIPIDNPDFDVMNFRPYVEAVVQLIENPRTTTPLSIAVNGPWGSGKTSLGRMVEARLRDEQEDRLAPIVTWFNAWLHDGADDLGAALTAHVGRELNGHRRPLRRFLQMLPRTMLTGRQRYRRKLWVTTLGFFIAITVAYGWVRLTTDGIVDGNDDTAAQSADDTNSVAGAAAEGGAGAALVLAILAAASRFVDPARSAAAFIASPRSEAQEGSLNEARKEIGRLLNQAGVPTTRTMVIFVDDLERSRPPSAIDICEVANQLLDHPGVFIVYLADMTKIASTVEIKYRDYAGSSGTSHRPGRAGRPGDNGSGDPGDEIGHHGNGWWGRAYMEKMVQIQIDIPELDRAAGSDLLQRITAQSRAAATRRQQEQRKPEGFSWAPFVTSPIRAAGTWLETRRKRVLVERLYRLVDSNRQGGSLDVDSFENAAAEQGIDPTMVGRVIHRHSDESETYRAAEAVAVDYLPNNPRAIKRLANRLRFEAEVSDELGLMFDPQSWIDPRLVGKWAVLTTRWPSLAEALRAGRIRVEELEIMMRDELAERLDDHVRPGVADHEIDHLTGLLTTEPRFGDSIDWFLYHRLVPDRGDDER